MKRRTFFAAFLALAGVKPIVKSHWVHQVWYPQLTRIQCVVFAGGSGGAGGSVVYGGGDGGSSAIVVEDFQVT